MEFFNMRAIRQRLYVFSKFGYNALEHTFGSYVLQKIRFQGVGAGKVGKQPKSELCSRVIVTSNYFDIIQPDNLIPASKRARAENKQPKAYTSHVPREEVKQIKREKRLVTFLLVRFF